MIGIIGAMEVEVNKFKELMSDAKTETISGTEFVCGTLWGNHTVVAVSGIGKVNAAICTQTMILKFAPRFIINSGVAGGLDPSLNICDTVIANAVVQHDMDTSPLGDPVGYISGLDIVDIPTDADLSEKLLASALECDIHSIMGKIVSGDQFINSSEKKKYFIDTFNASACEMEAAAIGHVCYKNAVPFTILRSISDSADDESNMTYADFVTRAAAALIDIIKNFYAKL